MLVIRPDQMMALSADGMERRILDFLRDRFPARHAHVSTRALSALIRRAMTPSSGMRTEQEVARYALFGLMTEPDFDLNPSFSWAWPVLRDPARLGEDRLNRLFALARRHGHTADGMLRGGNTTHQGA